MTAKLHTPADLHALSRGIFTSAGWSDADAEALADHLILANLTGHDSHGVGMIPIYITSWQNGLLRPENTPQALVDAPPFLTIDAHVALGQPATKRATERAVSIAQTHGVAVLNLVNAHHIGRIGHYAEIAAAAGMISMFWVNVSGRPPVVASFGAREPRFGTNPHAIGIPNGNEPLILDFATSRMAQGKTRVAFNKGERVPEGYIIDGEGRPTTDPSVVQRGGTGALLPFGDHKGAGIAMMAELLSSALSVAGRPMSGTELKPWVINNLFAVVFDPDRIDPDGQSRAARIAAITDYQRSARPAEGIDRVRAPGDKEREMRTERSRNGIPVDDETWRQLMDAAAAVGFKPA